MANDDRQRNRPTSAAGGASERAGRQERRPHRRRRAVAGLIAVTLTAPAIVSLTGEQMANAFDAIARPARVVSQSGVSGLLV